MAAAKGIFCHRPKPLATWQVLGYSPLVDRIWGIWGPYSDIVRLHIAST